MKERRLMAFSVSDEWIRTFLIVGQQLISEVIEGVPETAVFISQYYNAESMCIDFVFYDESFPPVALGGMIPRGWITLRTEQVD